MGALLDDNGTVQVDNITMAVDTGLPGEQDQRFNSIVYDPHMNVFLASWSASATPVPDAANAQVMGMIIGPNGAIMSPAFPLAGGTGAQMLGHVAFDSKNNRYVVAYENDPKDLSTYYFMDTTAAIDACVKVLGENGQALSPAIPVSTSMYQDRFVKVETNALTGDILVLWQEDFVIHATDRSAT